MKKIITISREYGAGGSSIGKKVAQALGYDFYDSKLIFEAAHKANIDVESQLKWDENVPTNFGFAQSLFDLKNKPLSEKLYAAQREVIEKLGNKGGCVIVGRNANAILGAYDHTLHVFVHADEYWRVEWMKEKLPQLSEAKIQEQMWNIDKKRKKYCAYHTKTEFGDSNYYDVSLKTSKLGIDTCAAIICDLVKNHIQ